MVVVVCVGRVGGWGEGCVGVGSVGGGKPGSLHHKWQSGWQPAMRGMAHCHMWQTAQPMLV